MHGHYRTLLKAGETITTRAGLTVHPEEVRMLEKCTWSSPAAWTRVTLRTGMGGRRSG